MKHIASPILPRSDDPEQVDRFSALADQWWNLAGPFRLLHQIQPLRLHYILDQAARYLAPLQAAERRASVPQEMVLSRKTLLDIGCGGGILSEAMARQGAEVLGIDASEPNIHAAQQHARQGDLTATSMLSYRGVTPECLVEEGRQFDIVLAMEVVEHVADIPLFLQSCAALLAPGGVFVCSTINRTFSSMMLAIVAAEYVLRWVPRGTHQWSSFVRPSELASALQGEGLQVRHMAGMRYSCRRQRWVLDTGVGVNYMLTATRLSCKLGG